MLIHALLLATLAAARPDPARTEILHLERSVPGFSVIRLKPDAGRLALRPDQALTADRIRGLAPDPHPPRFGEPSASFRERMARLAVDPNPVFKAPGIAPFRFRFFDCEFHHDGKGDITWPLNEYAVLHGFNRISFYQNVHDQWAHLPPGTDWVKLGGYHWNGWFKAKGVEPNRWDRLAEAAAAGEELIKPGHFSPKPPHSRYVVDLEFGGLLPVEELRRQTWYPADQPPAARLAFEERYYDGYTVAFSEPGRAARRDGWRSITLYAWQPFNQTWYGLDPRIRLDPAIPWVSRFLKAIHDAHDIVQLDGYCYEWSPRNTAFELLSLDEAKAYRASRRGGATHRLYFSPVILNIPEAGRWLRHQPLPNEEVRAIVAMLFFTGTEGFTYWNYAGNQDPGLPPDIGALFAAGGTNPTVVAQAARPFEIPRAEGGGTLSFRRYDFIHVVSLDATSGVARIRKIDPARRLEDQPPAPDAIGRLPVRELKSHLRAEAEPVAAVVEGMALARRLEYTLRHGEPLCDISMREAWEKALPLVRRVRYGPYHVIATYDPGVVHGGTPRPIELTDFNGVTGLTLVLPADDQVRFFVLELADH